MEEYHDGKLIKHECERCGNEFSSEAELDTHFEKLHGDNITAESYRKQRLEIEQDKADHIKDIKTIVMASFITAIAMIIILNGGVMVFGAVGLMAYDYIIYEIVGEDRPVIPTYTTSYVQPKTECYQSEDEPLCYMMEKFLKIIQISLLDNNWRESHNAEPVMVDVLSKNQPDVEFDLYVGKCEGQDNCAGTVEHYLIPKSAKTLCQFEKNFGYKYCPSELNMVNNVNAQTCKDHNYHGITLDEESCAEIMLSRYLDDNDQPTEEHKISLIEVDRFG